MSVVKVLSYVSILDPPIIISIKLSQTPNSKLASFANSSFMQARATQ